MWPVIIGIAAGVSVISKFANGSFNPFVMLKAPIPTVAAPGGAVAVGDFVIVDGSNPAFDNLPGLPQSLPAGVAASAANVVQARMRIETLTTPAGAGFVGASFADTRLPIPGILVIPIVAIIAKSA